MCGCGCGCARALAAAAWVACARGLLVPPPPRVRAGLHPRRPVDARRRRRCRALTRALWRAAHARRRRGAPRRGRRHRGRARARRGRRGALARGDARGRARGAGAVLTRARAAHAAGEARARGAHGALRPARAGAHGGARRGGGGGGRRPGRRACRARWCDYAFACPPWVRPPLPALPCARATTRVCAQAATAALLARAGDATAPPGDVVDALLALAMPGVGARAAGARDLPLQRLGADSFSAARLHALLLRTVRRAGGGHVCARAHGPGLRKTSRARVRPARRRSARTCPPRRC